MDLLNKYKPLYLNEYDYEYDKIIENIVKYLSNKKTNHLLVNGPNFSGKKTLLKLILAKYNYDYIYIEFNDQNSRNIDYFKNIFNLNSKTISNFFQNKKSILIIEKFDEYYKPVKDFILKSKKYSILISNKFICIKQTLIVLPQYSNEYLNNLYQNIYFIETNNIIDLCDIPYFKNINEMFSILEQIIIINNNLEALSTLGTFGNTSNVGNASNPSNVGNASTKKFEFTWNNYVITKNNIVSFSNYDKYSHNINDFIHEKNQENKQYILEKLDNNNQIQYNILNNFSDLDTIVNIYDTVCDSTLFLEKKEYEYYNQLTFMAIDNKNLLFKDYIFEKEIIFKKNKKLILE